MPHDDGTPYLDELPMDELARMRKILTKSAPPVLVTKHDQLDPGLRDKMLYSVGRASIVGDIERAMAEKARKL